MAVKKIIIIGPAYPLRGGGIATFNERLAREFSNEGHDVTIYTFSYQYPGFLFPGSSQYSTEPAPKDLKILIKINSINPFNWIKIGNEIKKLKPDLVIVRFWLPFMGPCLGTILRRIKKNHFTRVVCIADNIIPHEHRPGDSAFTKYFIKPVDDFITMSDKVLNDLKTIDPNKRGKIVAHPLYDNFGEIISKEAARANLYLDPHAIIFLFFGFIRKYKGLDILLEAFKIVIEEKPDHNLKLLIAGEFYEDKKNYEPLLKDPLLKEKLILHTHFISDEEVKYFFCASDCVVQPYRSATQSGVTPLSYYFEKPMIVTNVGGLPAMVPDKKAGLIAAPTPQDLAEKILAFIDLGEPYFTKGIKDEKNKLSWKAMTDSILLN
ncbi:MAG: glycosyltransferase [Bacteroidetes bacterium]|nr:glycosyltransferase [Bacteroidota bacterium]